MTVPVRQHCSECGKSLLCEHCGNFKWLQLIMIDNVVSPWYFCSEECKDKFQTKLDIRIKLEEEAKEVTS